MLTSTSSHVLEPHAHNSLNTHFIVSGELTVWKTKEARPIKTYRAGDPPFEVTANTCYRAAAGKEGCIFVEGHKDLSPTSAKRFEDKGMITRTPAGDMVDNRKDQILCTHGRCHWSHDKVFHMCAEFGEGPSRNQVCDFK